VIQRVTNLTLGEYLQKEVCGRLGLDYYFGVPDDALSRCAQVKMPPGRGVREPGSVMEKIGAVWPAKVDENSRQYRQAELPSNNGHGNARALAGIYSALLGEKLMRRQTMRRMTSERHNLGGDPQFTAGVLPRPEPESLRPPRLGRRARLRGSRREPGVQLWHQQAEREPGDRTAARRARGRCV
jgi:CubicO group peptidase (beta-lactamase class C family)